MGVFVLILWIVLACLAGKLSLNKGHSFFPPFALSLILSPLVGLLIVAVEKPNKQALESREIASGASRKCPQCAELIRSDAKVCRFCGLSIPPQAAPKPRHTRKPVTIEPYKFDCPRCGQKCNEKMNECPRCRVRFDKVRAAA